MATEINQYGYWNNKGKYQELANRLHKIIPSMGTVDNPEQNPALEKLRVATNCYYDLFNNGLINRASEFRSVFGFAGTWIAKNGFPYHAPLESAMDDIAILAAYEQGILAESK